MNTQRFVTARRFPDAGEAMAFVAEVEKNPERLAMVEFVGGGAVKVVVYEVVA